MYSIHNVGSVKSFTSMNRTLRCLKENGRGAGEARHYAREGARTMSIQSDMKKF